MGRVTRLRFSADLPGRRRRFARPRGSGARRSLVRRPTTTRGPLRPWCDRRGARPRPCVLSSHRTTRRCGVAPLGPAWVREAPPPVGMLRRAERATKWSSSSSSAAFKRPMNRPRPTGVGCGAHAVTRSRADSTDGAYRAARTPIRTTAVSKSSSDSASSSSGATSGVPSGT